MLEEWREVKGYEGLYKVSNYGEVKSLPRIVSNGVGFREVKPIIMKQRINSTGYPIVNLSKKGKQTTHMVHRLVGIAFLESSRQLPVINHIDGCKRNNRVDNLEWTTYSKNNKHAVDMGLRTNNIDGLLKSNKANSKPVILWKDNKKIMEASNSREAARKFKMIEPKAANSKESSIARAIRAYRNSDKLYYGYKITNK